MVRKRPRDSEPDEQAGPLAVRGTGQVPAKSIVSAKMASLEVTAGPDAGAAYQLTRMVTLIGRLDTCDIVMADQSVSREHGQIEQHQGEWVYTNLSDNGSWVNRKKVDRLVLKDGDTIEVGGETRMKFVLAEPEQVEVGPVVRRRSRPTRGPEAMVEMEEEEPQTTGGALQQSFLKRRKIFIAVGVYLSLLLVGAIWLSTSTSKPTASGTTSIDWWTREEVQNALETKFRYTPDATMASSKLKEAYQNLQIAQVTQQKATYLYDSVTAFQQSQAYSGGYFPRKEDTDAYLHAKGQLGTRLWRDYDAARFEYAKGHDKVAKALLMGMLEQVQPDNPFYKHVAKVRRQISAAELQRQ